jgi:predicted CXXCH cytochrome family protein
MHTAAKALIVYIAVGTCAAYGDPAACAVCHQQIARNYARTGMARSFRQVRAGTNLPEFDGSEYSHQASAEHFTALRRDGGYYVRRDQTGIDGKAANAIEVAVDYVLGSGNDWISYVHRTRDDRLVEFPVSWYPENGGHWGMSPGYDRANHVGFSRQVFYRCMFCHNAYPNLAAGAGDYDDAAIFPAELPEGIDCERCHGPGTNHIAAARHGGQREAVRAAIVNPARLSAERQIEICMQCHLETTQAPLPGSLKRFDRGVFSYRAGEPLPDYMQYFDHAAGTGHDDKFELISAAYRMRKSACFRRSDGRLTCTGCHDPHRALSRTEGRQRTDAICRECHQGRVAELVRDGRHTAGEDCASCHMPRRRPTTAIHIAVTDHLIQRPGAIAAPTPKVEEHDGNTLPYEGEVAAYYPKEADPLYSAIAQVKNLANVRAGLASLGQLLAGAPSKSGEPYFFYGEALVETGEPAKAVPVFQQAFGAEPGNWRYLYGLGQAWLAAGKPERALEAFQRALGLAPRETNFLFGLGAAYESLGRIQEAARTFREATRRNPEDAAAFNNLSLDLSRSGDTAGAEEALREAIRLQPERAVFHMNMAGMLRRQGKTREAEFELDNAVRYGPSTQPEADLTLGSLLLAAGRREEGIGYLKRAAESKDPRVRAAAMRLLSKP